MYCNGTPACLVIIYQCVLLQYVRSGCNSPPFCYYSKSICTMTVVILYSYSTCVVLQYVSMYYNSTSLYNITAVQDALSKHISMYYLSTFIFIVTNTDAHSFNNIKNMTRRLSETAQVMCDFAVPGQVLYKTFKKH